MSNAQASLTAPVQDKDTALREVLSRRPSYCPEADIGHSLQTLGLDVRPLPRAGESTPEALRAAVTAHEGPLLFHGLIDHWRSSTAWSPVRLAQACGDRLVTALMDLPPTGVLFPKDQQQYERELNFADFLVSMLSTPPDRPCYLAYQRAQDIFSPQDYDFTSLLRKLNTTPDTRVWVGSAGTRSMLHSDLKDNLFCQIWGEKHVVLLPWEHSRAAYPCPDNIVNSQLDLASLDLDRYPRLKKTVLYAGSVGPGDVLFMPRGCWHDIRSMTPSVSLNHWFGLPLTLRDYARLLVRLGPRTWWATAKDFVRGGMLGKSEPVLFFFSPPSTGKRLYQALRWRNFSHENDPTSG